MVQPGLDSTQGQWAPAPRPVAALGRAVSITAVITAVLGLCLGLAELYGYGLAHDYAGGRGGVTLADLADADHRDNQISTTYLIFLVATAGLLVVWAYLARKNAELICTAQHRRARGWVIGAWFCPVVNLWFPAVIMEDIHRASLPSTRRDLVSFDGMPGVPLIRAWWVPFALANVIGVIASRVGNDLDGLHTRAITTTLMGLLLVGSAVALTMVIRKISEWQLQPRSA